MVNGINYQEIQAKTEIYVKYFRQHQFNINEIKAKINQRWAARRKPPKSLYMGDKNNYLYF